MQGAVENRPTPGDHLVAAGLEHAHRDHLQAHGGHGQDHAVERGGAVLGHAQHLRNGVTVDVGVEYAHRFAALGQCHGEVDRHRRLAHAALAAGHEDHLGEVVGVGERNGARGDAAAQLTLHLGALLVVHRAQGEVDATHTRHAGDGRGDVMLDRALHRAAGNGEQYRQRHHVVVVDAQRLDHAEFGDRTLDLRVDHPGQRLADGVEQFVIGHAIHPTPAAGVVPNGYAVSAEPD